MEHLPSLSSLRSFEAAAKHQSFTLAAEELHMTQSAISRMVRELEATIGVTLFRPAGRGVALTDAGRALADQLHGDLDRLRGTIRNASAAGDTRRLLSIGTLPTFGSRWLAPRLTRFRASHPQVEFALHSHPAPFDLIGEGVDIAIHFGRKEWVDGTLTELCPEDLVAVASPLMADRHEVTQPTGLARLPLLHLSTRPNAWRVYFDALGLPLDTVRQGTLFDQFSAMISAAIHGLGAAIVPSYLIEAELAQGTLVILGRPACEDDRYYVVTPRGVANPLAAQFRDWLVAEARASTRKRMQFRG
ncbi:Glycine cleavage system transcriptional activator [Pelagimonas phthalicica]|uniref:Glycine cleavage system transcriptional activator n=1 Tax=Pelagimonas phthalicica TaxID=1037362 RepID=A0A238JL15_9RHOB|nr:LysR substrate-binding domain-containing protein [Pelagimonas phthalicica]TDS88400.1 LysR family transcriptional regulator [Pelagimonas phthalicica]SMX30486.1 Glycine cleavage system transcriptional activator [Pelagimonas phthalicica]